MSNNTMLRTSLISSANYIDKLGGDSAEYRRVLAATSTHTQNDVHQQLSTAQAKIDDLEVKIAWKDAYMKCDGEELFALYALKGAVLAILCDPEGVPCFAGSDGDRRAIAEALALTEEFK